MANLPDRTVSNKQLAAPAATSTQPAGDAKPKEKVVDFHFQKFASNAQQTKTNKDPVVTTRVNYFHVKLSSDDEIFVYQINFPNTAGGRVIKNRTFKKQLVQGLLQRVDFAPNAPNFATDYNSNLVSLRPFQLPQGLTGTQSGSQGDTSSQTYSINVSAQGDSPVQAYNIIVTGPQPLLQGELRSFLIGEGQVDHFAWLNALNVLTRNHATQNTVKSGADKFFPRVPGPARLGLGLQQRNGFFTSIRPVNGKVVLNMHGASSGFLNPTTIPTFVDEFYDNHTSIMNTTSESEVRAFDPRFKSITEGLCVQLLYDPPKLDPKADKSVIQVKSVILATPVANSKVKRVNGFGLSAAAQKFHHVRLNTTFSVAEYFNRHVLTPTTQLKNQHLLVCNLGTRTDPNWVPSELLYIVPDQPFQGQLPESAMREMVKVAQRTPAKNVTLIEAAFKPGQMFDSQQLALNGIIVDPTNPENPKMIEVKARMLPVPTLQYGGKGKETGGTTSSSLPLRNGKWNLSGKKFSSPSKLESIGVIKIGGGPIQLKAYQSLAKGLGDYGMGGNRTVFPASATSHSRADLQQALDKIQHDAKGIRPNFLLILLPVKNAETYAAVKWWADSQAIVHTVCVAPGNLSKLQDRPFQGNLALMFNVKSEGCNHVLLDAELKLLQQGGTTMVVGADVTHPGPGSVNHCPSVAAVVASTNPDCVNFPGSLRLQVSKQEMIADLTQMMVERLEVWYNKNYETLPSNILFYRDGVSESQFAAVRDDELVKIWEACEEYARTVKVAYNPKITVVVCGKRHHTRFYPADDVPKATALWAIDNNGNWRAGLVVDDPSIRNPYHFDFYLQSHVALCGTARPCHYFVIHNGMDIAPGDLQKITFNLCWTFARATTPIGYASPAYYADRLADRGRCYIAPFLIASHPHRPKIEKDLLTGLPITPQTPVDQIDRLVLGRIAGGWLPTNVVGIPHWDSKMENPKGCNFGNTMYYI